MSIKTYKEGAVLRMKDNFKFRGLKDNKWFYGAYHVHLPYTPQCCSEPPEGDYKHLIISDGFSDWGLPREIRCTEVDKNSIGRCSGVNDRNGNLIFQGDIVRCDAYPFNSDGQDNYLAEICWDDDTASFFYYIFKNPKFNDVHGISEGDTGFINEYGFEVIGNIHQNPELKGAKAHV